MLKKTELWRYMKQYDWEAPAGWTGSFPQGALLRLGPRYRVLHDK